MSKTKTNEVKKTDPEPRVLPPITEDATPEKPTPEDAERQRIVNCRASIEVVLAKFHCRIVAWPVNEPVGDGSRQLTSARFGVVPELE